MESFCGKDGSGKTSLSSSGIINNVIKILTNRGGDCNSHCSADVDLQTDFFSRAVSSFYARGIPSSSGHSAIMMMLFCRSLFVCLYAWVYVCVCVLVYVHV